LSADGSGPAASDSSATGAPPPSPADVFEALKAHFRVNITIETFNELCGAAGAAPSRTGITSPMASRCALLSASTQFSVVRDEPIAAAALRHSVEVDLDSVIYNTCNLRWEAWVPPEELPGILQARATLSPAAHEEAFLVTVAKGLRKHVLRGYSAMAMAKLVKVRRHQALRASSLIHVTAPATATLPS
jgi:hypothetical protein